MGSAVQSNAISRRLLLALLIVLSGLFLWRRLALGSHRGSEEVAAREAAKERRADSYSTIHQFDHPDARVQAPPDEQEAERQPVLRVMRWSGQPVSGAVVAQQSSGKRLGQTALDGEVALVEKELGTGTLVVMADGFISTELRLRMPPSLRTDVYLDEGAQIRGVVLDPTGLPAGAGMNVMAVNPLYYFNDRALGLTLSGQPLIPIVQTDENGAFVLRGLDPWREYRIFAAGGGLAEFEERDSIVPGPDAYVEVRTSPVYGVFLTFQDESGRPPQLAPMTGRWQGSATTEAQAIPLFTTKWTENLLGLDVGCNGNAEFYDRTLFYTTPGDSGESITLRYRAELPGYAPVDVLVDAGRAAGCLSQKNVVIQETGGGFGRVSVVLNPPARAAALLESLSDGRQCKLRLREVHSGRILDVGLDALAPSGFQVVDGVPFGEYVGAFTAPHQLFVHTFDFPFRVGTEPVTLDIHLPATGTLEMTVWRRDGSAYCGPLVGSHLRLGGNELDAFYFSSGPYRIPLLPNGEYRIVLDNLFSDDAEMHAQEIFIRADGETTRADWRIAQ